MAMWRDEISSIIAETERNLGFKVRAPQQRPVVRAPPATFFAPPPAVPLYVSTAPSQAAAAAAASIAAMTVPPSSDRISTAGPQESRSAFDTAGTGGQKRLLESVKFELDVRRSHTDKQLEAVREEVQTSMAATERKWVDIAKQIETSVSAQIEAEAKLRGHTDTQLSSLRDAAANAHQETLRVVSEFQQTAIDHSEVLRRLDADVSTLQSSTETRLAEESIKLSRALEGQQELAEAVKATAGAPHQVRLTLSGPRRPSPRRSFECRNALDRLPSMRTGSTR